MVFRYHLLRLMQLHGGDTGATNKNVVNFHGVIKREDLLLTVISYLFDRLINTSHSGTNLKSKVVSYWKLDIWGSY